MRRPRPESFDLPPDYEWARREKTVARIDRSIERTCFAIGVLIYCLLAFFFLFAVNLIGLMFHIGPVNGFIAFGIGAPLFILDLYLAVSAGVWIEEAIQRETGGDVREREKRFGHALHDWEYRNLPTKPGYWERRTGRRFGEELCRFFLSRGCEVGWIETRDRFGIDLIVTMPGAGFCCYCEGHPRRPVSASRVRTIAGLAALTGHRAILFIHSGHEDSQLELARDLGITIFHLGDVMSLSVADRFLAPAQHRRPAYGQPTPLRASDPLAQWPIRISAADDQSTQSSPISR